MNPQKQIIQLISAAALGLAVAAAALWLFATRLGTETPTAALPLARMLAALVAGTLLLALIYVHQQRAGAAWGDLALATFFLLVLTLPLLGALVPKNTPGSENRELNSLPSIPTSLDSLRHYPELWTAFFNDHFGWRSEMIYLNNLVRVSALRTSPSGNVVLGRNGWLYFAGEESIWDYQGLVPLDDASIDRIYSYLLAANEKLEQSDITFLVAIPPNKQSIYPEYLPESIRKIRPQTRLDQLLEYNSKKERLPILDLRLGLLEAKQKQLQYSITDTHWSTAGAFTAYQEIMLALASTFPLLQPYEMKDYSLQSVKTPGGDLAVMNNLRNFYTDQRITLIPSFHQTYQKPRLEYSLEDVYSAELTTMDAPNLPTAVIFYDSYGPFMKPFLSQHFRRAVYIRPHVLATRKGTSPGRLQAEVEPPHIDWDIVEREKPDVVILVFAERFLIHVGN